MQDRRAIMFRALVAVAWADGPPNADEHTVLEGWLDESRASDDEANQLRQYLDQPTPLAALPLEELDSADRQALLGAATLITLIDGEQNDDERSALADLAARCDDSRG